GIPELSKTESVSFSSLSGGKRRMKDGKCLDRADALIMAVFVLVFGFVDFFRLGNTQSVHSFVNMNGKQAVISFQDPFIPNEIHFFTGAGYGTYTFDFSPDGENYYSSGFFTQESDQVFRWETIYPAIRDEYRFLRITGSGNAWLGEVCVTDDNNEPVPGSCNITELTDEQELYCESYSFMNSTYFDEIYHARTAWEHLNNVYPYEISHPPLGKLIISAGIALFGMTPFGWRFSGTLFGVLMLPVMYILLKKMFGSRRAATAGTLVFATDFLRFVQTRIATIDTYSVFFILLMYLFMYIYITEGRLSALALCGISFGLGAAAKWTSLYAGVGLAVLWLIYHIVHREEGILEFIKNVLFCFVFFIILPCCIYYVSYIPYGKASGVTNIFSRDYLDIVLSNQEYMFSYHSQLVATHPYSSKWYQWVLNIRPILYYLDSLDGTGRISFGAFVNPFLCWGGLLVLFPTIYKAIIHRDRNAVFIVIGYFSQLAPWMLVSRLTFEYHYFPSTLFLVMAIAYVFSMMEKRSRFSKVYIWGFAGCSAALFLLFFPVLAGLKINNTLVSSVFKWLPTWPF
ncbi:MAG: glycosyltransferase family 39 protein, partial [Eubacteriales bacterium]|nr:glycosyltransferase family 39 protein [Eubacteriales bacterium]